MKYFLVIIISFVTCHVNANETQVFRDILKNNAKIQEAYQNYMEVTAGSFATLSEYLPQADLTYKDYKYKVDKSSSSIPKDYDITDTTIEVTQKLYEFGATKKLASARLKKQQYKTLLLAEIADNYIELIELVLLLNSQEKRLNSLEANLKLLEEIQNIAKIKYKSGAGSNLDHLQAQTEYMKAKSSFLTATKDLQSHKADFFRLTGVSYQPIVLDAPKEEILALHEFQELAIVNNLSLRAAKIDNNIAKNLHYIEHKKFMPEAKLYYDYNKTDGSYSVLTGSNEENSSSTYGISITVPLFKSGANLSSLRKAKYSYLANSFNFEDRSAAVRSEAVDIWEGINISSQIVESQKQYLEFSKQSLKAANSNYKYGKTDLLNLLEAQRENTEAEYELVQAENDANFYHYRYLYLIGKLSAEYFQIDLDSIFTKL